MQLTLVSGLCLLNADTDEDGLSDSDDPEPLVPHAGGPGTTGSQSTGGETGGEAGADAGTDSGTDTDESGGGDSGSDSGSDVDEQPVARSGGGAMAGLSLLLLLYSCSRLLVCKQAGTVKLSTKWPLSQCDRQETLNIVPQRTTIMN